MSFMDSLVIDRSKIRRELGWVSPFTQQRKEAIEQGLAETAQRFQGSGASVSD